ncbi:MAG TPA: hypothetical protein ENJ13_04605 [Chromatiales bacterium]|nr:hypothetical protein [Chromatiales bacterium]
MNAAMQSVFEHFMPAYLQHHRLTPDQGRVCAHIRDCRTEVLGGLQWQCGHCAYTKAWYRQAETVVSYLSCYSHKIALSDQRIAGIRGDTVSLHDRTTKPAASTRP